MADDAPYEVGYKKPPAHTRFKPGQSGNPKGKKPRTLNLKTDLKQELLERIQIREGDRHLKVSKQRALLKALVAKALKGDARAANTILQLVSKSFENETETVEKGNEVSNDEIKILEDYLDRRFKR